jgi:FkbM family methyltransferase
MRCSRLIRSGAAEVLDGVKRAVRQSPLGALLLRPRRAARTGDAPVPNAKGAQYDRETIQVLERLLLPDSCCIDVGAHHGAILQEMVRLAPRGTHTAFEPLPPLAEHLRRAFPQVRVHEVAVSDQRGTAEFIHVENDPAYSGLRERLYDRPDPVLTRIRVTVVRLDDVVPDEQPVRFVKLDIEGGEYHALRGAVGTIARARPVIVFEAGPRSTGRYGVGADEMYRLISERFGYCLSTMERWLAGARPYDEVGFRHAWDDGIDFYFIAYPPDTTSSRR